MAEPLREGEILAGLSREQILERAENTTPARQILDNYHAPVAGERAVMVRDNLAEMAAGDGSALTVRRFLDGEACWKGRDKDQILENPLWKRMKEYLLEVTTHDGMSESDWLIEAHDHNIRNSKTGTVEGHELHCATLPEVVQLHLIGERQSFQRFILTASTLMGPKFWLDPKAPKRPKPTKLGAKLEPPYPDHYYEGPYELFLQTGGIFLMPGYSGRRLWVDGAQIWEPAPRQVAMMIMGDNTQPQLMEPVEPVPYRYDKWVAPKVNPRRFDAMSLGM